MPSDSKSKELESTKPVEQETEATELNVSQEFKNALTSAQSYSDDEHMSKQGIYDHLISDAVVQFTENQAQYAIDHLN